MHEYNNDLNSVRNIPYNVLRDVFIMSGTERGRRAVKGQSWNLILGHCSKDLYTWAGITLSYQCFLIKTEHNCLSCLDLDLSETGLL